MNKYLCRHCSAKLTTQVLDLGHAPPSNSYILPEQLNKPELTFPLRLRICEECWLLQTEDYTDASLLFDHNYAYFSSTSQSWLEHAKDFVFEMVSRLGLSSTSHVLEIASNDGYLLRNFIDRKIPCLGIEPTKSTAIVAEQLGIPVERSFFDSKLAEKLAKSGKLSDLVIANNVLAHVPDINDFCLGLAKVLKPNGVLSVEVPYLVNLIRSCQFDTVYHEHFSYFSFHTINKIFAKHGLKVFDVEKIGTHGGSLRVFACLEKANYQRTEQCIRLEEIENQFGIKHVSFYSNLQEQSENIKDSFIRFLIDAKAEGKSVAAYGAAAKGNTLLNFAGIRPDLIRCVFDAAAAKQGKFLPGSHIPILSPKELSSEYFDYIVILPWNLSDEISIALSKVIKPNTFFVTAIPEIKVFR